MKHNWTTAQTFKAFGAAKLTSLCSTLGFEAETALVLRLFDTLIAPWSERLIGSVPTWTSDITDDHTPFEFSLAFDGIQPELRLLIEAQGNPTTLVSSWAAALDVNECLNREFGVSLEQFKCVKDLFEPHDPQAKFSLWHSFCLKRGADPKFKLYLNPQARGPRLAAALVEEALERLGFTQAWHFLSEVALRSQERDELVYFSLDLSACRQARVKVYIAHRNATAGEVEEVLASGPQYVPGDARMFCQVMTGGEGPFDARPLVTCFAFTADNDARPFSATLHLPIRCYVDNDRVAMQRICDFLTPQDSKAYEQAISIIAGRPLKAGVGIQAYTSFRRQGNRRLTTIYLSPEAYEVTAPHTSASRNLMQL